VRVFLLDDHEVLRGFLRDLIDAEDDLIVVGTAGTAAEAMVMLTTARAEVAVLDVHLPDRDGIEVCRDIRSSYPEIRCLMLTSYPDEDALAGALGAGASAYLLKQVPGDELVDAIRRVGRGELLLRPPPTPPVPPPPQAPVEPTVEIPVQVPVEPTVEAPLDISAAPIDIEALVEPPIDVEARAERVPGELYAEPPVEELAVADDPNAVPDADLSAFLAGGEAAPAAAGTTAGATPPAKDGGQRRRGRWLIPVGFLAGVAAVVLLVVNPFSSSKSSRTASPRPSSVPSSVTTAPPTTTPPETAPTTAPGPPPAPVPPGVASRMAFSYPYADCLGGRLSVPGSVTNNATETYSLAFTVSVIRPDGSVLGTASATAPHLAPGETRSFTASGSCNGGQLAGRPSTTIDSITTG
jgi:CheY-like chemotaxis protein